MPIQDHHWVNKHASDCPITYERKDLLDKLSEDPTNSGLLGAVPEYDEGGDQEVENCTCHLSYWLKGE